MTDLRQALEWIAENRPALYLHVWTAVDAARRFLALTETGPDYEAALEAARIDEEENWAMAVAMDPEGFVRAVVDAALAPIIDGDTE